MQRFRSWLSLSIVTIGVMVALGVMGCGKENSVTGADGQLGGPVQGFADPLDGVLDSTDGATPSDPTSRIDRLAEVLGLDDDQKALLLAAYGEFHTGLSALRGQIRDGTLSRPEAQAQFEVLRDALEAELQVILTAEQYDLLQEMRASRDGRGRHGRRSADRWAEWLDTIGADEQQVADVTAALQTLRDGARALHDQVLAGDLTREDARPQIETLRADFDAALQSILTQEQYDQLEELRPDCRNGG